MLHLSENVYSCGNCQVFTYCLIVVLLGVCIHIQYQHIDKATVFGVDVLNGVCFNLYSIILGFMLN